MSAANKPVILGVNCHHGDASACLLVDGVLVAAAEEERFRRRKHCGGFPADAIRYCLRQADVAPEGITHLAVNRDRSRNLLAKGLHVARGGASAAAVLERVRNARKVGGVAGQLAAALGLDRVTFRVCPVEHHLAHLASAYLTSPWQRAAVASLDGSGDFRTALWGVGTSNAIAVTGGVDHPHSLGLFYLAMTQYLGFPNPGDEGKLMGLAAYGEPRFAAVLGELIRLRSRGRFTLDTSFFRPALAAGPGHEHDDDVHGGPAYTERLCALLGPARVADEPLAARHQDIAASVQRVFEQVYLHVLGSLASETGEERLCLAGGCALNGVANGRLVGHTGFRQLHIPPAPGDAGGAVGSALWTWHRLMEQAPRAELAGAFLGPAFKDPELAAAIDQQSAELSRQGVRWTRFVDIGDAATFAARRIADGAITGWFQGRMEWGPRALGHRSILADPRRADIRERLNQRIKRREGFRPFAPAVLRHCVANWFDIDDDVPFMNRVVQVRSERRAEVPAITHVDGTARVQTVRQEDDPALFALLGEFHALTGVPMVINTSFNENEPIVNTPAEALDCFLRTRMDLLVLGNHAVWRDA